MTEAHPFEAGPCSDASGSAAGRFLLLSLPALLTCIAS